MLIYLDRLERDFSGTDRLYDNTTITTRPILSNTLLPQRIPTTPASIRVSFFRPLPHHHPSYAPTEELHDKIFAHLNMRELLIVAATSKFNRSLVYDYIEERKKKLALHFFKNAESFFDTLSHANAVISGSTALHLLLPAVTTNWVPSDLDLYVPSSGYSKLEHWIARQGYCISHVGERAGNVYLYATMEQKLRFSNGLRTIEIVVSKTEAACAPIFQFHSTAVMNFFSAERIFCAYPKHTFAYLSMVNPGRVYCDAFQLDNMDALRKYEDRGFTYVPWQNGSTKAGTTSYESRTLSDKSCMFIKTTRAPSIKHHHDVSHRTGVIDVEWCLGGRVSTSSLAFVYP